jgi:hypothetical protein
MTQAACAKAVGIERGTLVNYELGKTPLRCEVALRFCRQMILSEEWLATGRFDACHSAAQQYGFKRESNWAPMDKLVFIRQCVDLLSEPLSLHVPPGTLFSEAYDRFLAPKYRELVGTFFHHPRIRFSDSDKPELAISWLTVVNERCVAMLLNEANRRKVDVPLVWRKFIRCLFEATDLTFRKFMGFNLTKDDWEDLSWLRDAVTDPAAVVGPLQIIPSVTNRVDDQKLVASKN